MSWLGTIGALASTAGTVYAADRAADAQIDAARSGMDLQRQIYNQRREDTAPFRQAGYNALAQQERLLGLGGGGGYTMDQLVDAGVSSADAQRILDNQRAISANQQQLSSGDLPEGVSADDKRQWTMNRMRSVNRLSDQYGLADPTTMALRQTPGYQFRMDEGVQARDRSAAARGMTLSGRQQEALTEFGQGLADQTYGNQYNRLAGLAGTGQTSVSRVGSAGSNMAANNANALMNAGQAQAQSYAGMARAGNQLLGNLDYFWGGS